MTEHSPESLRHFLAHADRCWKAAEANGARLAARANLILTGVSAVFGIKIYSLGGDLFGQGAAHWAVKGLFWLLSVAALVCLLGAFLKVLGVWRFGPQSQPPEFELFSSAEHALAVEDAFLVNPGVLREDQALQYLFTKTYNAAVFLQRRNARRKAELDVAQKLLLTGLVILIGATVVYTLR